MALQRTVKYSPSKLEGVPEGEGVCLCCKDYSLQRGVLQGRFLHFCMVADCITDPFQYKNVRMTVFILYIRHFIFSYHRPAVIE